MRVLVLGASGLIGRHVVSDLAGRGHEALGLARSAAARSAVEAAGGRPLAGDLAVAASWAPHLAAADAVVHAAATFDARMAEVDRSVVAALAGHPGRLRVVYTGGCWLYGDTQGRPVDEESPLDPLPAFAYMVDHWDLLRRAGQLSCVLIHPAMVFADDGGCLSRFARDARERGRVRIFGGRQVRWPMVHAADLADLYVRALEAGDRDEVFHAASIESLAVERIARAASRIQGAGEEPEVVPVQAAVAEFGDWAEGYGRDQAMRSGRARRRLGWSPTRLDWETCLRNASPAPKGPIGPRR